MPQRDLKAIKLLLRRKFGLHGFIARCACLRHKTWSPSPCVGSKGATITVNSLKRKWKHGACSMAPQHALSTEHGQRKTPLVPESLRAASRTESRSKKYP